MDHAVIAHVVVVVFLATLIRSSIGFGEALVAVPLLALRIPVDVAAPLAVLVSITIAAIVLLQDWREVHVRSAGSLFASTLVGIPVGLWLLIAVDARIVKALLAVVLITFAITMLTRRVRFHLDRDRPLWLAGCGFAAGVLGGAYGMNGPPLVIYGSLRRWSAAQFRATLQGYFLPASVVGMLGYWLAGLWVPTVTRYFVIALPGIIVATLLGRMLHRRIRGDAFFRWVCVGLILIGVVLLGQAGFT